jgi:hypothetical protein
MPLIIFTEFLLQCFIVMYSAVNTNIYNPGIEKSNGINLTSYWLNYDKKVDKFD